MHYPAELMNGYAYTTTSIIVNITTVEQEDSLLKLEKPTTEKMKAILKYFKTFYYPVVLNIVVCFASVSLVCGACKDDYNFTFPWLFSAPILLVNDLVSFTVRTSFNGSYSMCLNFGRLLLVLLIPVFQVYFIGFVGYWVRDMIKEMLHRKERVTVSRKKHSVKKGHFRVSLLQGDKMYNVPNLSIQPDSTKILENTSDHTYVDLVCPKKVDNM
ncbi:unnamed protein product [Timema podura]|uniref:Uncharacterized protein n=1 Tax=Timema podura TaxID=61482 RepID=A0ABN7NTP4_TIMPD|nr:unnamed protein product [Timema podura]